MLPSDEWRLINQHWHGYAGRSSTDRVPDAVLRNPSAVATWITRHQHGKDEWHVHAGVASRGDSIQRRDVAALAVADDRCTYGCASDS